MKSGLRSTLSLFLLTALLFTCLSLSSCTGNPQQNPEESSTPSTETEASAEPASVPLVVNGTLNFRLIRSENASTAEIEAAQQIRSTFLSLYPGQTFAFETDFSKDGTFDSSAIDILVGFTEYPETKEVLSSLSYGEYAIRAIGNKIVIASWQTVTFSLLSQKFCSAVKEAYQKDASSIVFTETDSIQTVYNNYLKALPSFDGKTPDTIYNCGDSAYEVLLSQTDPESYRAYCEKLEANGYTLYSTREVVSNLFSTYLDDSNAVTVYFTPVNHCTRVIVEPKEHLFTANEETYQSLTTPKLTMIGRRFSENATYLETFAGSGLMCFLLRLSDGRFIVIDGGVATSGSASYAQALYAKMREQAVDPNHITIAAWFITHTHTDHVGGFLAFSETYSSLVTLENMFYNFPSESDAKTYGEDTQIRNVTSHLATYYKTTPVYKIQTGQVYQIADARIEILYTHADLITASRNLTTVNNYNDSSAIFSLDIAGNRLMFLGDSQEVSNDLVAKIYGSYLKSDILQVAHHGGVGGTKSIYAAIDPEVALFTTSDELIPKYISTFSYNYYLIYNLHLKEYYNAADRIISWDLPYHATSSGFIQ